MKVEHCKKCGHYDKKQFTDEKAIKGVRTVSFCEYHCNHCGRVPSCKAFVDNSKVE